MVHNERIIPEIRLLCYHFFMARFLGIDYGAKRIGIAISDKGCTLAFPKEIISNDKNTFEELAKIIKSESISEIVIGESLNFSGKPNLVNEKIENFTKELELKFFLPIHRQKEFLTSVEARRYNDKGRADAKAAALILQRYLDKTNNQK